MRHSMLRYTVGVTLALAAFLAHAGNPTGAPASWPYPLMDDEPYAAVFLDRLEYGDSDEGNTQLWDAQGWFGGDIHKLWFKTEGEGPTGETPESAEVQALYSRTISPFWDLQAGVRFDERPNPSTGFAVLGVQGLAPYWFEVDANLFARDSGDVRFRLEAEYDLLLTQFLILQPRFEASAAADDVPDYGLASGLNSTEMGLRLRYEIRREFAPYVGVRYERLYGDTRDIAEAEGESGTATSLVLGLRAWF